MTLDSALAEFKRAEDWRQRVVQQTVSEARMLEERRRKADGYAVTCKREVEKELLKQPAGAGRVLYFHATGELADDDTAQAYDMMIQRAAMPNDMLLFGVLGRTFDDLSLVAAYIARTSVDFLRTPFILPPERTRVVCYRHSRPMLNGLSILFERNPQVFSNIDTTEVCKSRLRFSYVPGNPQSERHSDVVIGRGAVASYLLEHGLGKYFNRAFKELFPKESGGFREMFNGFLTLATGL